MQAISYQQVLEDYGPRALFVDLRSPKEYEESTIPGAINLPILDGEEHRQVSILYKEKKIDQAKSLGVRYASAKLSPYFDQIQALQAQHQLVLFCSRGGYRSRVLADLCQALDLPVRRLDQGYKGYRRQVLANLEKEIAQKNYLVLDGYTGVGKTEILHHLRERGQGVLDLEGLANHRGSQLGDVGLGPQPSQKMFESLLYQALLATEKTVFIEGESTMIGQIHLPRLLKEKMRAAPHIYLQASQEDRLARLKKDYLVAPKEELIQVVSRFRGKIKEETLDQMLADLAAGRVDPVIRELMGRYDQIYRYDTKKMALILDHRDLDQTLDQLLAFKASQDFSPSP